ncbi:MAG TPA: cation acetate symporter [Acidimicrobiales bacterium]|nr:cation acetate symporter [Acidimicrobiales bacterium]
MNDYGAVAGVVVVALATLVVGSRGVRVSRTPADFLVAARQVPAVLNASAISGEYLSAASFLGIAGLALADGVGALWYAVGYAAGYLVLLATVAAPLRRFGAYTIPDFAEGRLDSPLLRRVATVLVLFICAFYLLPQMEGAGETLQVAFGGPYWVGVVVLGIIVTSTIAGGGMKGITFVQSFQYWLKMTAIALPAVALLAFFHHPPLSQVSGPAPAVFARATTVRFPAAQTIVVASPVEVTLQGRVDATSSNPTPAPLLLGPGEHRVAAGTSLGFPAGAHSPTVRSTPLLSASQWNSPLVRLNGRSVHPLAATYGVILATFLGALGLPHILVRFYTNPDGQTARRTTAFVVLLLSCFYVWPAVFALLGRLEAPGLYLSGRSDTVVLALPHLAAAGAPERILSALTAGGAFAAFLSTSSGLLIAMAGALSHDIMKRGVRAFRWSAVGAGTAMTAAGLAVAGTSINVLVGWAFAVAASSFCPLLVLGIWWPRLTWPGALTGLALGGGASSAAVVASLAGAGRDGWAAVVLGVPAIWTVPLSFAAMIVVSLLTPSRLPADVMAKLLTLHLPEDVRRVAARARR